MKRIVVYLMFFLALTSCEHQNECDINEPSQIKEEQIEDYIHGGTFNVKLFDNCEYPIHIAVNMIFLRGAFTNDTAWYFSSIDYQYFVDDNIDLHIYPMPTEVRCYFEDGELNTQIDFGVFASVHEPIPFHGENNKPQFTNEFNEFNELEIEEINQSPNFHNPYMAIQQYKYSMRSDTLLLIGDGFMSRQEEPYVLYKKRLLMKNVAKNIEFDQSSDYTIYYFNPNSQMREDINLTIYEEATIPECGILNKDIAKRPRMGHSLPPRYY